MKKIITTLILVILATNLFSQEKEHGIQNDLINSSESLSLVIWIPNSLKPLGFMDTSYLENDISDSCVYLNTDSEKNLEITKILADNNILENTYWYGYDGSDFVDKTNELIVQFENVKVYLEIDFETPGHFDKIYIPITNFDKANKIITDLSILFDQKECFTEFKNRIKT